MSGTGVRRPDGWSRAVIALLVVAAVTLAVMLRGIGFPQELWVRIPADGSYDVIALRDGPDGPPDPSFVPEPWYFGDRLRTPAFDEGGVGSEMQVSRRPGALRRLAERLGLPREDVTAQYRLTGEVRRAGLGGPRTLRVVRADWWRDDLDRYAQLVRELRDAAAGRRSAEELRRTLDTVGWSPCGAIAAVWPAATKELDEPTRGTLAGTVVEAIAGRVAASDAEHVHGLIEFEPEFVHLLHAASPETVHAILDTHDGPCGVCRTVWRLANERELDPGRLAAWLVDCIGWQPSQTNPELVVAARWSTRKEILRRMRLEMERPFSDVTAIRYATVGLSLGDPTWFSTCTAALRRADAEAGEGSRYVVQFAAAGMLRWVLDPALAERLLAGTSVREASDEERRVRWRAVADAIDRESPLWTFDESTRTWRTPPAPPASSR